MDKANDPVQPIDITTLNFFFENMRNVCAIMLSYDMREEDLTNTNLNSMLKTFESLIISSERIQSRILMKKSLNKKMTP